MSINELTVVECFNCGFSVVYILEFGFVSSGGNCQRDCQRARRSPSYFAHWLGPLPQGEIELYNRNSLTLSWVKDYKNASFTMNP